MTGPAVPFREIVLKVHSRCDLACDHCYVYEHADQSWRTRPKVISDHVIRRTAQRLAEHAGTHALPSVTVILHGGEPLLAGPARLRTVCEEFGSALAGIADLDLRIHTNGLQLSPRYLDLFDEFGVKVGISLDGDKAANDRHRRYADGRSSHPLVLKAVELLGQDRYRHLNLGLLCTIDIENDPVAVLDALTDLEPPLVDFLLPHATWDEPPPRPDGSPTAYATWLLAVFDRWQEQGRPVPVRLFSSVLSTLGGGPSLTESLGLAPTDLVVVETDGQLEQVDSLKSAYEGAAATGFDVFTHSLDEVAGHPGVRARQLGLAGVGEACRRCPVVRSCGGGLYTHRYRSASGFDNPSVYCADLEALVRGIQQRTESATVSPALGDPADLAAAQQDLTRTLLALLHADLDGRAGQEWDEAWAIAAEAESSESGAAALDEVLAHPYARTWLLDVLEGLRAGSPEAVGAALRLSAQVAAAAVRGGLDLAVPVTYRAGRIALPTLGELRLGGPGESGRVSVRATGDGFEVRSEDGTRRAIALDGRGAPGWRPVRRLAAAGAPAFLLDDLDPYRDCFTAPAAPRLAPDAADRWAAVIGRAWALLAEAAPEQAAAAAAGLTTLTPVRPPAPCGPGRQEGRPHGYGALGLPVTGGAEELALALLRGHRRTGLRALLDVTDLYASDGAWTHRSPWQEEEVPFSRLLADAYERVGLAALDPRFLRGVPEALDLLEGAAEPTVDGLRLLDLLRKEASGAVRRGSGAVHTGTSRDKHPRITFDQERL
ncbi:radical SAM/SPASM protein FxsB, inactivated metallohydrolase extension form [Streptomyces sp. C11-1]|uniref:Radical SAM/SPASM protein FxsB, inactivated metallohydrolase extension form n=1 Tax=Streptomyces durocortorensis TaxID=2811104 RepID=A0ABY9VQP0_9ACTN|nr:radical SAM/SPASM protein FxsB, inactivated metallohydrolase extension form [Streptomyces durocortorensis]WNF26247.1 radical SAM/SPASM protein FxsB, inactivated metallohydrolase extension form [Streptomyces durocortorensis]